MKKLFVSFMTALLIATASASFAAPTGNTQPQDASVIVRAQTMKLDVVAQTSEDSQVAVRLLDANGHTLIKKFVNKGETATRFRFDLSNLADGEYQVEISDGNGKQVKSFTIQTLPPALPASRSISLS